MRDNYDDFFLNDPPVVFTGISTNFNNLGTETHNTIVENVGQYGEWKGAGTDTHWFTVEWIGFFKPPGPGGYTFSLNSDDSTIMWIDDAANDPHFFGDKRNVALDNAGGHGMLTKTYYYNVDADSANRYHPIRIRFEEWWGGYGCIFKILDSKNNDVSQSSLFSYSQTNLSTYYSLVRTHDRPNMYNCYVTNNDTNVRKSQGKGFLYRSLTNFNYTKQVNGVGVAIGAKNTNYLVVGDDGTLQIYDATKEIDVNGQEVRDANHPEFVCRLNGPFNTTNIQYWLNWDGNLNGDEPGVKNNFLSWQDWLKFPRDQNAYNQAVPIVKLWYQLNARNELKPEDYPKEIRADGVFNLFASPNTTVYWPGNNFKYRNVIMHRKNPFNKTGREYSMVGASGNYKMRMTDQGQLQIIYAVPACESVKDNNKEVIYTPSQSTFAFYNVNGEPRTNRSFYYDQSDNTLSFIDKSAYTSLYQYSGSGKKQSYTEYKDIYVPPEIFNDAKEVIQPMTKDMCQSACDTNEKCKYFYSAKIDGKDKCYIDSGNYPYKFTPSADPNGGKVDYIKNNPSSLYVKEQTLMLDSNAVSGTDVNMTQTDYLASYGPNPGLPAVNYTPAAFKSKFPPNVQNSYFESKIADVKSKELQYYYPKDLTFGPKYSASSLQNVRTVPAGYSESGYSYDSAETFVDYYGKEGFVEGYESIGGLTGSNVVSDGGDNPLGLPGGGGGAGGGGGGTATVKPNLPTQPLTSYSTTNTNGETVTATDDVFIAAAQNNKAWFEFVPPPPVPIIQKDTRKNVAYFNMVKFMMQNVYIHLPLYRLETRWDLPNKPKGCFNRGYSKDNFSADGSCPDNYHIIKTTYDWASHHNAVFYGSMDGLQATDPRLPFSDGYLNFTGKYVQYGSINRIQGQFLEIPDTIDWPANHIKFSFYFKASSNTPQWARIFDFSNGIAKDNIMAYISRCNAGGLGLAFQCQGRNVYNEYEPDPNWQGGDTCVLFENVQDKWHFCQWYLGKWQIPNRVDGNPYRTGWQILWLCLLHTLNDDNTVEVRHIALFDTTFSNFRNQAERKQFPNREKYIKNSQAWSGNNKNTFMGHPDAYTEQDGNNRPFKATRNYVTGYDSICIASKLMNDSNGSFWGAPNLFGTAANNPVTPLKPVWLTITPFRISFPVVSTTRNYINASPWGDPSIIGSIRDFKVVFNEPNYGCESAFPSSFSWCVDTPFTKKWLREQFINTPNYNNWQLWTQQPIITDNNTGVFSGSTLIYDFMSPQLSIQGIGVDNSKLTKYDPNITNNVANFIYSQIIYYQSPSMLKDYINNMHSEAFTNMEGFSFSSVREGLTNDGITSAYSASSSLRDSTYNLPSVTKMYDTANNLNSDTAIYAQNLGQIAANTNTLQTDLVNYHQQYLALANADNNFYDFSGNELLYYNNKDIPSLRDTKISDNQQFIIQQNTVYIIGTITCASMILAAIILARQ
jgi:hypothetical protein